MVAPSEVGGVRLPIVHLLEADRQCSAASGACRAVHDRLWRVDVISMDGSGGARIGYSGGCGLCHRGSTPHDSRPCRWVWPVGECMPARVAPPRDYSSASLTLRHTPPLLQPFTSISGIQSGVRIEKPPSSTCSGMRFHTVEICATTALSNPLATRLNSTKTSLP